MPRRRAAFHVAHRPGDPALGLGRAQRDDVSVNLSWRDDADGAAPRAHHGGGGLDLAAADPDRQRGVEGLQNGAVRRPGRRGGRRRPHLAVEAAAANSVGVALRVQDPLLRGAHVRAEVEQHECADDLHLDHRRRRLARGVERSIGRRREWRGSGRKDRAVLGLDRHRRGRRLHLLPEPLLLVGQGVEEVQTRHDLLAVAQADGPACAERRRACEFAGLHAAVGRTVGGSKGGAR